MSEVVYTSYRWCGDGLVAGSVGGGFLPKILE